MTLDQLRDEIDSLDNELLKLINRRMEVVHKVGELKNSTGGAIYRPEREKAIIERLDAQNDGKLNKSAIEAIFLEIFAVSRNLERAEKIAYLGPEGSFTHQAAEMRFGGMSDYIALGSIKGVCKAIATKKVKYGVIPIENSSNGIVSDTVESFNQYDLKIVAEVVIDIHHSLATKCENVKDIKNIYSKDIAIEQCREFLSNFGLDEAEKIPVESTAKAAKIASTEDGAAAICSHIGAKIYNLPIMFENIEDTDANRTRFLIVSDFDNGSSGCDKTSILASLPNKHGALVRFLTDFDENKINLTKIKSHITKGKSLFFIDFDGHFSDENVANVLSKHKNEIKLLGSYVKEADDI
jgi:chorismate mutase/prephenate dehydratase